MIETDTALDRGRRRRASWKEELRLTAAARNPERKPAELVRAEVCWGVLIPTAFRGMILEVVIVAMKDIVLTDYMHCRAKLKGYDLERIEEILRFGTSLWAVTSTSSY